MDLEPTEQNQSHANKARKIKDLGPLHALLIRGLPEWVNEEGVLRTYDLAEELGMSYQALYAIYSRGKLPGRRIAALVELSRATENAPENFKPLSYEDFAEFLG